MNNEFYTVGQFADALNLPKSRVYSAVRYGELKARKFRPYLGRLRIMIYGCELYRLKNPLKKAPSVFEKGAFINNLNKSK